jgi:phenylpropionate dioxygenase-like ring-hydroxylating dioxygenase large terminal subunit
MTSTAGTQLVRAFDAYDSPRGLTEDADLTRVGRGTPMGELMRRYWQPVAFTHDVSDLPLKVRLLGEDLVLFRTGAGDFGLVEQRCSHRGASLEYGVISERGIRCAYHGFHYAPDGSILETGAGAPLANGGKICHGAYPLHVFHGLIFTYMGPPELKPPFPMLDLYTQPHVTVEPGPGRTCVLDCNWLQVQENGMDPVHAAYLHVLTTGAQRGFSDAVGITPILQFVEHESGICYITVRRMNDDDLVWVRVSDRIMPNVGLTTSNVPKAKENISQRPFAGHWVVPIDDYNTKRLYLMFNDDRNPLRPEHYAIGFGQVNDRPYPERQRQPGDYEAMHSQGPIAIHAYENLTPTDYGVIALRYLLTTSLRAIQEGRDPLGIVRDPNHVVRTRAQTTIVRVPRAATPAADEELLKRTAREIAESDLLHTLPPV